MQLTAQGQLVLGAGDGSAEVQGILDMLECMIDALVFLAEDIFACSVDLFCILEAVVSACVQISLCPINLL